MTGDRPISETSNVKLGLVMALLCAIAWSLGKWSDFTDKYQTKELAAAQAAVVQAQITGLKDSLSGQIEALRAEVRAADRGGR